MTGKIITAAILAIITAAAAVIAILVDISKKPQSTALFPASVTVYDSSKGKILQMPYESFVEGCICGIIPKTGNIYEEQTLAALAVVINTNALYALKNNGGFTDMGADFAVSEEFPFVSYTDKAVNHADRRIIKAAVMTAGKKYLAYEGEPVRVSFCTVSSGKTRELPFMPSRELLEDTLAKGFLTERAFTEAEILSAFSGINLTEKPPSEWFENPVYDEFGELVSVEFLSMSLSGEKIRSALKLKSSSISIEYRDETFFFTGKGNGDNAGMSLNAANIAAKNKKSFDEILSEFYSLELVS